MRAKFLLDEQISRRVAAQAAKRGLDVRAVDGSNLAGQDDPAILRAAIRERRIFVTYNSAHFAPLLVDQARSGAGIPGIVFVDGKTIPTSGIGGLVRALGRLARKIEAGEVDPSGGIFLGRV